MVSTGYYKGIDRGSTGDRRRDGVLSRYSVAFLLRHSTDHSVAGLTVGNPAGIAEAGVGSAKAAPEVQSDE